MFYYGTVHIPPKINVHIYYLIDLFHKQTYNKAYNNNILQVLQITHSINNIFQLDTFCDLLIVHVSTYDIHSTLTYVLLSD